MLNHPMLVTQSYLDSLAKPFELAAIRLVLPNVDNDRNYSVHGVSRHYCFAYDQKLCAHVLTFPMSAWMAETPVGAYRKNNSFCWDVMAATHSRKIIPIIIPLQKQDAQTDGTAPRVSPKAKRMFRTVSEIARVFGCQEPITEALDVIQSGISDDDAETVLQNQLAAAAQKKTSPRIEKYRETIRLRKLKQESELVPA